MQFYKTRINHVNSPIPIPTLVISILILLNIIGTIWIVSSYSSKVSSIKQPNRAFITFTNNDQYSNGVVALAESLKEVKSKYPLIAMVTPQVSQDKRNLLSDIGVIVKLVHELDLPEELRYYCFISHIHSPQTA